MASGPPLRISREAHAIVEAMHRAKYPGDYPYSPTADGECLAAALDAALAREATLGQALVNVRQRLPQRGLAWQLTLQECRDIIRAALAETPEAGSTIAAYDYETEGLGGT